MSAMMADDGDGAHPERIPASKRIAFGIAPSGRFFAPHNPDCAKVRELSGAFRGVEAVSTGSIATRSGSRARQVRTRDAAVDDTRTTRIRVATTSENRIAEDLRRHDRVRAGRETKKPLADDASGFRATGNAGRTMSARGNAGQWPSSSSSSA
jgi:hypothetical protein